MIFIMGGTSDGREIAEKLENLGPLLFSVATPQGAEAVAHKKNKMEILVGRMDENEIGRILRERKVRAVVDCTHPYAVLATKNARRAAEEEGISYFRFERPESERWITESEGIFEFNSYQEAGIYLNGQEGRILSTLGSKNFHHFSDEITEKRRIIGRVLPEVESIQCLKNAGLLYDQIIAMKGPFSLEMNELILRENGIRFLVTKESGAAGGFSEKVAAAKKLGVTVVVIGRERLTSEPWIYTSIESLVDAVKNDFKKAERGTP